MPTTKERQIVVRMKKTFRNLFAGERANFGEALAAELVKRGIAERVADMEDRLTPHDVIDIPPARVKP